MANYQREWHKLYRLRLIFFLVWLAFLPVVFTVGYISAVSFHTETVGPTTVAGFLWMGFFYLFVRRIRAWKCPRCHKPFHLWWKGIFTTRCAHCGLQEYSQ
jgi:hypothetical protein